MFFKGFMMSIYFSTTLREENFSREENFAVFIVFTTKDHCHRTIENRQTAKLNSRKNFFPSLSEYLYLNFTLFDTI